MYIIRGENVEMHCKPRRRRRRHRDDRKIILALGEVALYVRAIDHPDAFRVPAIGKAVLRWLKCTLTVREGGPLHRSLQSAGEERLDGGGAR
ncbi:MAG TPA: hypothetical protein VHZ74_10650 [Bryobacteraceae bacterium]|jgi:hypothetical protein|nr:hypothetical protein [Bryobacteraceae bacterium]